MAEDKLANPKQNSFDHNVVINGTGSHAEYAFSVSGAMDHSGALGGSVQGNDVINYSFANGSVVGGTDSYKFDGKIHSMNINGDVNILLDGDRLNPADYPSYFVTIRYTDNDTGGYEFVANNLKGVSVSNGAANPPMDELSGGNRKKVEGSVGGGMDAYVCDGGINWSYANEAIVATVNGDEVNTGANYPVGVRDLVGEMGQNRSVLNKLHDKASQYFSNGGEEPSIGSHEKELKGEGYEIVEVEDGTNLTNAIKSKPRTAYKLVGDTYYASGMIHCRHPVAVFGAGDSGRPTINLWKNYHGGEHLFLFDGGAYGWQLRNFTVNCRPDEYGARIVTAKRGGEVHNVDVLGEINDDDGSCGGAYLHIPNNERVVLDRLRLPDGADRTGSVPSYHDSIGVIMIGTSNGLLRMDDCVIGSFPNNGVYASGSKKHGNTGRAVITNHTGYGSDRDQLRIGYTSEIHDSLVYSDKKRPGHDNLRGVWVRYGRGALVENTTVKTHTSDIGSAIRIDSTTGEATVKDCEIVLRSSDDRSRGVLAYSPSDEAGNERSVTVENNKFRGDANTKDVILIQRGRDGSVVRNNDIDVPNAQDEVDVR